MPSYTVAQLAELVQGEVVGDASLLIEGVADLATAQPRQLSFLGNRRYLQAARRTQASAVLVPRDIQERLPCTELRVANANAAFTTIAALFAPKPVTRAAGIHPAAVVDPDAKVDPTATIEACAVVSAGAVIGARTVVGAGSYIGHEAQLGEDCFLHPHVCVREGCRIANRVILHCGAVIGSDGFGYEFEGGRYVKIPQTGYVQLDDDVEVGANSTIDRGRFGRTWIQRGCKIDNLVMVAHNVVLGENTVLVAQVGISGSTVLGKYCTIAGQTGLAGHLTIGDHVTITAQSGVTKDVPAKSVLSGRHAVPMREALRLEALTRRLPELLARLEKLESQIR